MPARCTMWGGSSSSCFANVLLPHCCASSVSPCSKLCDFQELQPATTGDAARPTPEGSRGRGMRTVVLGAGMAGLATARVLSDFFDEVVLLERDSIESEHQVRITGRYSWTCAPSSPTLCSKCSSAKRGLALGAACPLQDYAWPCV